MVRDSGGLLQTAEQNGQLLLSFDVSSLGRYASDSFERSGGRPMNGILRLDTQRAVPILQRLAAAPACGLPRRASIEPLASSAPGSGRSAGRKRSMLLLR